MRWAALWLATGLFTAMPANAMEPRVLPDFTVYAADGERRSSADLAPGAQWLLVYTTPDCDPCARLLRLLGDWRSPGLVAGTVLVVGAPAEQAGEWVRRTLPPEITELPWYADGDAMAWERLGLGGAPIVIGVQHGRIVWVAAGLMADAGVLGPAVRTWIGGPRPR
jgi:hypothetical protein